MMWPLKTSPQTAATSSISCSSLLASPLTYAAATSALPDGAAFEFFRDRSLNANDPINIINGRQKSPYHFNQFGGDVGGPVLREKLFFFFDYDGQRNTLPNLVFLGVPAPATPTANQQAALSY